MYLRLENLCKHYGGKAVVDGLDAEAAKGELVCLLGPSGCGKTTTLNMIGGFIRPSGGRILLEERDITALAPQKRPVSTVFQNYALFPHMSVVGNVMYGLKFRKGYARASARARALAMIEAVGLQGCEGMNAARLSGGQQQRVALARSLVLSPKVLLMDEPLSNLDAKLRIRMRQEIKRIQREFGITMVFVTHDQEEAMSISDRIMVMHQGRIDQAGTPEEIYRNPRTRFIADFIGRINFLEMEGRGVFVRPEHMRIRRRADGSGDGPAIRGVVGGRFFLGNRTCYAVDTGYGEIEVDVAGHEDGRGCRVGEEVELSIEQETRLG